MRNIQALRAVAALLVVLIHAGLPNVGIESVLAPTEAAWLSPFHGIGIFGVDLFFAISGFIMLATNWGVVLHYLKAVHALGSAESGAAVVRQMKAMPTDDAAFGRGTIRADGRAIHENYVFQVKTPQQSHGEWDLYNLVHTVPGDVAFRPMDQGGCPLLAEMARG